MINEVAETMNRKTTSQYMIIEDRFYTLKRYLELLIKDNRLETSNVECILKALDDEPLVLEKECENND